MQTFLPYADFKSSALVLDCRRLGKQRVECKQIYQALVGLSNGWRNHPATKMWAGNVDALMYYMACMTDEWIARGYRNNLVFHYEYLLQNNLINFRTLKYVGDFPEWLGDKRLHDSHKSNLLRKFPEHYAKFGWDVKNDMEYWWPSNG